MKAWLAVLLGVGTAFVVVPGSRIPILLVGGLVLLLAAVAAASRPERAEPTETFPPCPRCHQKRWQDKSAWTKPVYSEGVFRRRAVCRGERKDGRGCFMEARLVSTDGYHWTFTVPKRLHQPIRRRPLQTPKPPADRQGIDLEEIGRDREIEPFRDGSRDSIFW